MGPISIILAPSLPRQNTTVAAPQTLPWFWSNPTVVLIGPYRSFDPPTGSFWFFDLSNWTIPPHHNRQLAENHHLRAETSTRAGAWPHFPIRSLPKFVILLPFPAIFPCGFHYIPLISIIFHFIVCSASTPNQS